MQVKILEVRDEGTFIPLLCVDMNPGADDEHSGAQRWLLRRCGYPCDGEPNIAIVKARADGDKCSNDPYYWGDRTFTVAHKFIIENWRTLSSGDIVDVSYILGESATKKISQRLTEGAR